MPIRVLQVGPGDFCRLAFQPIQGQKDYDIFYGGPAPEEPLPPWTSRDGLLLETRRYSECDLSEFEAVRQAFEAAAPIAADYVPEINYAWNPVSLDQGPFFSHFSGWLRIPSADTYGWITSSQDCSFLLIDDRVVASAPGRHGPIWEARPGTRADIHLSAGQHKFDYYHAAAGDHAAMMIVAWVPHPTSDKDRPSALPPDAFNQHLVGHLPAGRMSLRTGKLAPDFEMKIGGEVPLPDNPLAMVDVAFRDLSPKALSMQGKPLWEFGDGQTSTAARSLPHLPSAGNLRSQAFRQARRPHRGDSQPALCGSPHHPPRGQAASTRSIPEDSRNLRAADPRRGELAAVGRGF